MRIKALLLITLLIIPCTLLLIPAGSSATRTIVVPDQYATIGDAIGNATEGDTVFVKHGIYEERSITVNKTLRLIGENKADTTIICIEEAGAWDFSFPFPPNKPNGVNIQADDVVISGFTIKSIGQKTGSLTKGIEVVGNGNLITDNIVTELKGASSATGIDVTGSGNQIVGNLIQGANTGISLSGSNSTAFSNIIEDGQFLASGQYNIIMNNTISKGYTYGMDVEGDYNLIWNNTVSNQITGIYVNGIENTLAYNNANNNAICGISIRSPIDSIGNNAVYANTVSHNRDGIFIVEGKNNTIYANNILCNHIGATIISYKAWMDHWAYNNTFYHNNFIGNTYTAADWNTRGINLWDNGSGGNYWSGYTGTDTNRDGVGDTQYRLNLPYQVGNSDLTIYDPKKANPNDVKDRFPLISTFDTNKTVADLPSWAADQLPTLAVNQTTIETSQEPNQAMNQLSPLKIAIFGLAIACIITAGLVIFFKRRRVKVYRLIRISNFYK